MTSLLELCGGVPCKFGGGYSLSSGMVFHEVHIVLLGSTTTKRYIQQGYPREQRAWCQGVWGCWLVKVLLRLRVGLGVEAWGWGSCVCLGRSF